MKKIVIGTVVGIAALFAVAGCTSDADNPSTSWAKVIDLPDGRQVVCVYYDGTSYGAGLSCDWEHAK